jgi:cell division transport system permease protein
VIGWFSQQLSALRDAARRLSANPLAATLNVLVIGVALSLPVALYLGLAQLQAASRQLTTDPQVSMFLELEADAADRAELERRLRAHPHVSRFEFVPKQRALEDLERTTGLADVFKSLPGNPLPDAFVVIVKDNRPDWLEALRDEAIGWPRVAHAQLDSEWARRLQAVLRVGRTLSLLLGMLLGSALVAVTFNTIRLQILTRREEIEVARLIGATHPFIRRPFLYFGMLQGLAGGLAAWLIVAVGVAVLNLDIATLAGLYGETWKLRLPSVAQGLALLLLAGGLGWLGAWLSVSRHLWRLHPA